MAVGVGMSRQATAAGDSGGQLGATDPGQSGIADGDEDGDEDGDGLAGFWVVAGLAGFWVGLGSGTQVGATVPGMRPNGPARRPGASPGRRTAEEPLNGFAGGRKR